MVLNLIKPNKAIKGVLNNGKNRTNTFKMYTRTKKRS